MRFRLGPCAGLCAGLFAFAGACANPTDVGSAAPGISLSIVSGNTQSGSAGQELPQPLVVKAVDNTGKPLKAYLVTFRVTTGGGRMYSGTSLTDARGIAQDWWTLGPTGGTQQVDVVAVDPLSGVKQNFGVFNATATVVPVPVLGITPGSNAFGLVGVGAPSAGKIFTISNTGGAASGTLTVQVTGANSSDFVLSANTCTGTLAGGASCTFTVTFTPGALGSRTATVGAAASPGGNLSAPLSGEGALVASLQLSTGVDFGEVEEGASSTDQVFTVTNAGGAASGAIITWVSGSHAGDFAFSTDTCVGVSLAPGASCQIAVKFSPVASGVRTASLNASATPGSSAQTALSGTGLAAAAFSLTPNLISFGAVKATGAHNVEEVIVVTNVGGSTTQALTITLIDANFSEVSGGLNDCSGTTLTPGASCEVKVRFDPSSPGLKTAKLDVSAANVSTVSASLAGHGAIGAELRIAPDVEDFGTVAVGGTRDEVFTVTNIGDMTTGAVQLEVNGTNASDFNLISGGTCVPGITVLAAGQSCTVFVRFTPADPGARTATLTATDGSSGLFVSASLIGSGT